MPGISFAHAVPPADKDYVAIRETASDSYQWQWSLFTAIGDASHFRSPHLASLDDAKALATAWAAARDIDVIHLLPMRGADDAARCPSAVPLPAAQA